MLGFLRWNFALASADIKLVLYKTLVRPKLEYASSIWDPHINSLLHDIEAIQNRSARFILSNYFRTASVSSLKSSLNLLDLSVRRKISRLCLFHKIYHANSTLKDSMLFPPTYHSTRNDHQFKVGVPSSRTNYYFNSFIPKTSSDWNHLPTCIASIINPANFKVAISGHITRFFFFSRIPRFCVNPARLFPCTANVFLRLLISPFCCLFIFPVYADISNMFHMCNHTPAALYTCRVFTSTPLCNALGPWE